MLSLPYTLCFCLCGSQVLMLYRNKPPNAERWNGLGGRIEDGESALACIQREVMEEARIDLACAQELRFGGLVTWGLGDDPTRPSTGMHTFLAQLPPDFPTGPDRLMDEGLLSWKELDWVCDRRNRAVVSNISRFLPLMLADPIPREYHCEYRWHSLRKVIVQTMPVVSPSILFA